jgi:hypothetical protein
MRLQSRAERDREDATVREDQQLLATAEALPVCGSPCKGGGICKSTVVFPNGRCALHGGLSTGPKTDSGRRRALNALERVNLQRRLDQQRAETRDDKVTRSVMANGAPGADGYDATISKIERNSESTTEAHGLNAPFDSILRGAGPANYAHASARAYVQTYRRNRPRYAKT